ncbi:sulfate transporter family-domain-containing protein [Halteromyces radiatus]|uniref:sulfate transporter family-domain-containing protein n=1 Tax=Halteromyces radiatus TaxID=101107 RepID=UPI00221FB73C|nr:sulfate transporter family-domain-containing protein [Halteromyces radiatus]KAI8098509.1 sulfate transporter family-domain-containing protein [Halteromyces radiatus]
MSTTLYLDGPPKSSIRDQVKATLSPSATWLKDTFPVLRWLPKYNRQWFYGDLICAITVGIIVIPQSMAYAKMAGLPPQFGLYSSVIGVFIYPWIGTSKDISIGTSAINSLLVGQITLILTSSPEFQSGAWTISHITSNLTLVSGLICLVVGILRLGILFDFICQPAIAGFMAGSGLTIVINQLNKIFGIPNINTTQPTYLIFGNTLKNLPHSHWDVALGLPALVFLYGVRYFTTKFIHQYPKYSKYFFFLNISRNIIVVVFSTLLSFLINHFGHFTSSPFKILGVVPAGFQNMGVPTVDSSLLSKVLPNLVGVVVLQIMEHCSIATSLGKITDYKIQVNQEITSIGIANVFGSFFSAYPMTGAFSRTAVMSKSGCRTPLTNVFVGTIVVLTIYFFTPALQYIPDAAVGAIVCHAVTDLITGPKVWVKFWNTHPSELLIFASAYVISLFTTIDISVYVPVAISIVVQLYRVARPKYAFLGRVDLADQDYLNDNKSDTNENDLDKSMFFSFSDTNFRGWIRPIDPSIVCFQPRENLVFENTNYLFGKLLDQIKLQTRRGKLLSNAAGARPWNDPVDADQTEERPVLSSIIFDVSGVHTMDYTAMESLVELSRMVDHYSNRPIPWFIVVGSSDSVRHSLLYAGFGRQQRKKIVNGIFTFHNDIKKKHNNSNHNNNKKEKNKDQMTKSSSLPCGKPNYVLPSWCHCQSDDEDDDDDDDDDDERDDASNRYNDQQPVGTNIRVIRDRYPYFYLSLHEAAYAALDHRNQQCKSTPSDAISIQVEDRQ